MWLEVNRWTPEQLVVSGVKPGELGDMLEAAGVVLCEDSLANLAGAVLAGCSFDTARLALSNSCALPTEVVEFKSFSVGPAGVVLQESWISLGSVIENSVHIEVHRDPTNTSKLEILYRFTAQISKSEKREQARTIAAQAGISDIDYVLAGLEDAQVEMRASSVTAPLAPHVKLTLVLPPGAQPARLPGREEAVPLRVPRWAPVSLQFKGVDGRQAAAIFELFGCPQLGEVVRSQLMRTAKSIVAGSDDLDSSKLAAIGRRLSSPVNFNYYCEAEFGDEDLEEFGPFDGEFEDDGPEDDEREDGGGLAQRLPLDDPDATADLAGAPVDFGEEGNPFEMLSELMHDDDLQVEPPHVEMALSGSRLGTIKLSIHGEYQQLGDAYCSFEGCDDYPHEPVVELSWGETGSDWAKPAWRIVERALRLLEQSGSRKEIEHKVAARRWIDAEFQFGPLIVRCEDISRRPA